MQIFADGFSKVTMSNNNLRIELTQNGPDNTIVNVGTLIIPANQTAGFVNAMANSLKQLDDQIKARAEDKPAEEDMQ